MSKVIVKKELVEIGEAAFLTIYLRKKFGGRSLKLAPEQMNVASPEMAIIQEAVARANKYAVKRDSLGQGLVRFNVEKRRTIHYDGQIFTASIPKLMVLGVIGRYPSLEELKANGLAADSVAQWAITTFGEFVSINRPGCEGSVFRPTDLCKRPVPVYST